MGKQQKSDDLTNLYNTVSQKFDIGTIDEFKSKMATPDDRKKFYDVVMSKGFTLGDYNEYESRLMVKQTEVSPQGSTDISAESAEPIQNTPSLEVPPQPPKEDYSAPSLVQEPIANETQLNPLQPARDFSVTQAEAEKSMRLPVTAVDSKGNPTELGVIGLPEAKVIAPALTPMESVANSMSNVWTSIKSALPETSLAADRVIRSVAGDDVMNWLTNLGEVQFTEDGIKWKSGQTADEKLQNTLASLKETEAQMKQVIGTTGQIENAGDLSAYVVDSFSSLLSSAVIAGATQGSALLTSMTGQSIKDYYKGVATAKGITEQEAYKADDVNIGVPIMVGGISYMLENIGLKGVGSALTRKLTGSFAKKAAVIAMDVNKEGMTEWIQYGLEGYNAARAKGMDHVDAEMEMAKYMASREGFERYAKGAVGSGAAVGGGRAASVLSSKAGNEIQKLQTKINSSLVDIAADNVSDAAKSVLAQNIEDTVGDIQKIKTEEQRKLSRLSPAQVAEINTLQEKASQLKEASLDENISEESKGIIEDELSTVYKEIDTKLSAKKDRTGQSIAEAKKELTDNINTLTNESNLTEAEIVDLGKDRREFSDISKIPDFDKLPAETQKELGDKVERIADINIELSKPDLTTEQETSLLTEKKAVESEINSTIDNLPVDILKPSDTPKQTDTERAKEITKIISMNDESLAKLNPADDADAIEILQTQNENLSKELSGLNPEETTTNNKQDEKTSSKNADEKNIIEENGKLQNGQEDGFQAQNEGIQSKGENDGQNGLQEKVTEQAGVVNTPASSETINQETIKPQENATQRGNIEQNSEQQYQGVAESQQGKKENRNNQEKPISEGQTEAGGSNSIVESRQTEEVNSKGKKLPNFAIPLTGSEINVSKRGENVNQKFVIEDSLKPIERRGKTIPSQMERAIVSGEVTYDQAVSAIESAGISVPENIQKLNPNKEIDGNETEQVKPAKPKTSKILLKGISDKLAQTGLSKSVSFADSKTISEAVGVSGENVNGYVDAEGNIVINSEKAGVDSPVHEFAHVWEQTIEKSNPELHAKGMELIQGADGNPYVDYVKKTQPSLEGNALYKEALAQAIGDNGAKLINSKKGNVIKKWLNDLWNHIAGMTGISGMTAEQVANLNLEDFSNAVAVDLLSGKPYAKMPNGDVIIKAPSEVSTEQDFKNDFIKKMKQRNGISFSGNIQNSLSDSDFVDFVKFMKISLEDGTISTLKEARDLSNTIGITNKGQIDMAYQIAKGLNDATGVAGVKKSLISAENLGKIEYEKLTDAEYKQMGKDMVDQGLINPSKLTRNIIEQPRALQPYEVTALTYYRSEIESQFSEISNAIDGDKVGDFEYLKEKGIKAAAAKIEVLNQILFDLEAVMFVTANQQSAAFRLRSLVTDKDFNTVAFLAEMKSTGYVSPELEARVKELGKQLNDVRAKLKTQLAKNDKLAEQIAEGNIVNEAKTTKKTKTILSKDTKNAVVSALDGLDLSSFGLAGVNFQANDTIRFSVNPSNAITDAVTSAVAKMKETITAGKTSVPDAIETAIQEINDKVGEGKWDAIKFRSQITNLVVGQGVPVKSAKPYVNSAGVLVVPGTYLRELVDNGQDTIDKMVAQANKELGGSFSEYDIRNAISGYGREASPNQDDVLRKINKARTMAGLLSALEDLQTKGERVKTGKQKQQNDTAIQELQQRIKNLEYELEMTPEERAQLAEQKYNETRQKYINKHIEDLKERIANKDFAPKERVNRFQDNEETRKLKAEAEKVKNEFKKEKYRNELDNRTKWQKWGDIAYGTIFNTTRALSAGADLSAIGVQGAIFTAARPKQAYAIFKDALKKSFSEEQYNDYFTSLQADPFYEVARKGGLNLQLPSFYQSVQEEQYKGEVPSLVWDYTVGKMAKKIGNLLGKDGKVAEEKANELNPYAIADRNYSVVLSSMRMQLFKEFVTNKVSRGTLDLDLDAAKIKEIAEVVNTITMASKVPGSDSKFWNKAYSTIFFSARKLVATWKIFGMAIPTLVKDRQLFMDAYGGIIGKGLGRMMAMGLAPYIAGTLVMASSDDDKDKPYWFNENFLNAKHSDFMKIILGDTRISMFQGIDGNVVFLVRELTGEYMTSSSKEVRPLNGEGINKDRLSLGWQYISNKFAPTFAIGVKYLGDDKDQTEARGRIQESMAPMWITGGYNQYDNTGNITETALLGALGIAGLSYNNYGGADFAKGNDDATSKKAIAILDKSDLTAYDPAQGQRSYYDGKDVVKVKDGLLPGTKIYTDKYIPAYQDFMKQAVVSNEKKLDKDLNWEKKEGVINELKREAYKYAELKTSGLIMNDQFKRFSSDGTEYKLLKSQYNDKVRYINEYMSKYAGSEKSDAREEVFDKLDEDKIKATPEYKSFLIDLRLYNYANSYANQKLIDDDENGKLKLIKSSEYTSEMDTEE